MSLLSCGFESHPDSWFDYEAYRGFYPIDAATCECYDFFGEKCFAWCTLYYVNGFEIVTQKSSGIFEASCSIGNNVLGCHIKPDTSVEYDLGRKYYPSADGTRCICEDQYTSNCYATCASGIFDYEIITAPGTVDNVVVSCTIPGNVVLGCGQRANTADEKWPSMYAQNQTSCLCYNWYGNTCYAICGKIIDNLTFSIQIVWICCLSSAIFFCLSILLVGHKFCIALLRAIILIISSCSQSFCKSLPL